jgi:hypothetical protein
MANYALTPFTEQFSIDIQHVPSGREVNFDAFLISLGDSFKPNFKSTPVYGRMDSIVNYQNTSRTISLSFAVPAKSENHAIVNLENINELAKFQYPSYHVQGQASGIASAPICKLKFHNLIQFAGNYLYGHFSSIDFSPVNESGYFTVVGTNNSVRIYPKEYKLSLSFTVLHTKPLGWSRKTFSTVNFPYNIGQTQEAEEQAAVYREGGPNPADSRAQALIDNLGASIPSIRV